jgi:RND family efflux transporter MFP subunit
VLVVGGVFPALGASGSSPYITSRVTQRTITSSAAATGNVSAAQTYALTFGAAAQPASTSTSSSSSSSSSNAGSSSTTWPVTSVSVKVGDTVASGQLLAEADPSYAQLQLQVAQANLTAAKAKLSADKSGPDAATRAAARLSVTQARTQLSQARQSDSDTLRQNSISLSQARSAVTRAKAQLKSDKANSASAQVIAADKNAITQAEQSLSSTEARLTASDHQAANQVTNAENSVTSAENNYAKAIAAASAAQIATDESAVLNAQSAVSTATTAVQHAKISAPVAGLITAVSLTVGANAPSGSAITLASSDLQVAAQFAETDLGSLKVGQPASVTIKAIGSTPVDGQIVSIAAQAGSTSGGVVSYPVTVSLTTPPTGILIGMSAQISITLAQATNVLAVPTTALSGTQGAYTISVLDANGQPQQVAVQVGLVTNSLAEITSGVTAGQQVITGTTSTRTGSTTTGGFGAGLGGTIPGVNVGGGGRFNGGGNGGGGNGGN